MPRSPSPDSGRRKRPRENSRDRTDADGRKESRRDPVSRSKDRDRGRERDGARDRDRDRERDRDRDRERDRERERDRGREKDRDRDRDRDRDPSGSGAKREFDSGREKKRGKEDSTGDDRIHDQRRGNSGIERRAPVPPPPQPPQPPRPPPQMQERLTASSSQPSIPASPASTEAAMKLQNNVQVWKEQLLQASQHPQQWLLAEEDISIPLELAGSELYFKIQQLRGGKSPAVAAATAMEQEESADIAHLLKQTEEADMAAENAHEAQTASPAEEEPGSPLLPSDSQPDDEEGDDFDLYGDLSMPSGEEAAQEAEEEVEDATSGDAHLLGMSTESGAAGSAATSALAPSHTSETLQLARTAGRDNSEEWLELLKQHKRLPSAAPELLHNLTQSRLALMCKASRGQAMASYVSKELFKLQALFQPATM